MIRVFVAEFIFNFYCFTSKSEIILVPITHNCKPRTKLYITKITHQNLIQFHVMSSYYFTQLTVDGIKFQEERQDLFNKLLKISIFNVIKAHHIK